MQELVDFARALSVVVYAFAYADTPSRGNRLRSSLAEGRARWSASTR